jgi:hypothetical protein
MTNHDVVKKLVGKIRPVGESNTDAERLENLKEMCHLVEMLLMDIVDLVHDNKDDKQGSVRKCGDYAANFLKENINPLVY